MREAIAALESGTMARAAFGDQVVDHYLNYARTEQALFDRFVTDWERKALLRARLMTHEKRIEIRWRDVDAYRHVNNAVYATYLEECRDEFIIAALGAVGDPWDYVLARVAIDFRREVTQEDDAVLVRCSLARIGTSSLTLAEEIVKLDGTLAGERRVRARGSGPRGRRVAPLTDAERAAFERSARSGLRRAA